MEITSGTLTEEVFAKLFDKYWYKLYHVASSRLGNTEDCEGMVQDVFLKLWERRADLQVSNIEHYLFRAIRFAVIDYIRKAVTQDKHLDLYKQYVVPEYQVQTDLTEQQIENILNEGIGILPEQTALIFRLSYNERMSKSEIAGKLDLSEKAIEYHLTKSGRSLRNFLHRLAFLFF